MSDDENIANSNQFDFDLAELIAVHIVDSWLFEPNTVDLSPRFTTNVEYDEVNKRFVATVKPNPEFIDCHGAVNLKVLVGKNGSGKTTFMEMLDGLPSSRFHSFFLLYRDTKGRYATRTPEDVPLKVSEVRNDKIFKVIAKQHIISGLNSRKTVENDEYFEFRRSLIESYIQTQDLYDEGRESLFTHFFVSFWNYEFEIDMFFQHTFFVDDQAVQSELVSLLKSSPLLYLFLISHPDYESLRRLVSALISQERLKGFHDRLIKNGGQALENKIKLLLICGECEFHIWKISDYTSSDKGIYKLIDYSSTRDAVRKISEEISDHFNRTNLGLSEGVSFGCSEIDSSFWFCPIRIANGAHRPRLLNDLSTGEYLKTRLKYWMLPRLVQKNLLWMTEDEIEVGLHPEWCRQLVSLYLDALEQTRAHVMTNNIKMDNNDSRSTRRYGLIMAAHSPFVLSDLLKQNILVFCRDATTGKTSITSPKHDTFAGNIGEMFYETMFMEKTVGEYADRKIQILLKACDAKQPDLKELKNARKLFSCVGDRLLKQLLLDRVDVAEHRAKN